MSSQEFITFFCSLISWDCDIIHSMFMIMVLFNINLFLLSLCIWFNLILLLLYLSLQFKSFKHKFRSILFGLIFTPTLCNFIRPNPYIFESLEYIRIRTNSSISLDGGLTFWKRQILVKCLDIIVVESLCECYLCNSMENPFKTEPVCVCVCVFFPSRPALAIIHTYMLRRN